MCIRDSVEAFDGAGVGVAGQESSGDTGEFGACFGEPGRVPEWFGGPLGLLVYLGIEGLDPVLGGADALAGELDGVALFGKFGVEHVGVRRS